MKPLRSCQGGRTANILRNKMIETKRPIPAAQIKLLLWDLDGTLVDSELDLAHAD